MEKEQREANDETMWTVYYVVITMDEKKWAGLLL